MFDKRTMVLMAKVTGANLLFCASLIVWPGLMGSALGVIFALPFISLYVFDAIGIPALLDSGGACGWGWCGPTFFGVLLVGLFWLVMAWFLARLIVRVTGSSEAEEK